MAMLEFPDIEPVLAGVNGNSYTEKLTDSTITVTTDALYKKTRPRTTRKIHTWSFSWRGLSDDDYQEIKEFVQEVGTHEIFLFTPWFDDADTYNVRITELTEWTCQPYGWEGSLTFEEV